MAGDYSDFMQLSPPRRTLDKARFFLERAGECDVNDLVRRREAVFYLDAALVAMRGFIDIVGQYGNRKHGWRGWWTPKREALWREPLWSRIADARDQGVHVLLTPTMNVQHHRGAGPDYAELHFATANMPENTEDEMAFKLMLGADSAITLLERQLQELERLLAEVEVWVAAP